MNFSTQLVVSFHFPLSSVKSCAGPFVGRVFFIKMATPNPMYNVVGMARLDPKSNSVLNRDLIRLIQDSSVSRVPELANAVHAGDRRPMILQTLSRRFRGDTGFSNVQLCLCMIDTLHPHPVNLGNPHMQPDNGARVDPARRVANNVVDVVMGGTDNVATGEGARSLSGTHIMPDPIVMSPAARALVKEVRHARGIETRVYRSLTSIIEKLQVLKQDDQVNKIIDDIEKCVEDLDECELDDARSNTDSPVLQLPIPARGR